MEETIQRPDPFEIKSSFTFDEIPFDIDSTLILKALTGSHAYGMAREDSDVDVNGIFVAPLEQQFSLDKPIHVVKSTTGDASYHEVRAFAQQAVKGSPRAIELLFTPNEAILEITDQGLHLIAERDLFLNRRIYPAFDGIALNAGIEAVKATCISHPEIRASFGYDTKKAMHAVRLYRSAAQLLTEGTLDVKRGDATALLAIRDGAITADEFARFDTTASKKVEQQLIGGFLYDERAKLLYALEHTQLPQESDSRLVNKLLHELCCDHLGIAQDRTRS